MQYLCDIRLLLHEAHLVYVEAVGERLLICGYVAVTFVVVYVVDGDEYTCLFDVAKLVVDGCAEYFHRVGKIHVGVDKWRYVLAKGAYFGVEYPIVVFDSVVREEVGEFFKKKRAVWCDEAVVVGEMFAQKV